MFSMKAVILAAGRGLRMGELTNDRPKPMLHYLGKNLLENKIDVLPEEIDEVIMVVGYLKESIMDYFGEGFKGKKIKYVVMEELTGSAQAVFICKEHLNERFMVLMGDDIYTKEAIENAIKHPGWSLTFQKFDEAHRGAVTSNDGIFAGIEENVPDAGPSFASTGLYVLGPELFSYDPVQIPGREEYGLPHTILAAKEDHPVTLLETTNWIQITTPEDLK